MLLLVGVGYTEYLGLVGVGYAGAASRVEVLVLRRFSHIAAAWSAAAAAGRVVGPQSTFATAVAP